MITKHLRGALDLQGMKQVHVMKLLKEHGGKVDGLSDKGVFLNFDSEQDADRFAASIRQFGGLSLED